MAKLGISQRYLLCFLMFSGLITNYMLRVNMSIAIVAMTQKANSSRSACVEEDTVDDGDESGGTKLDWSSEEVSWVLLSFFIGYAAFQVPGGRLAEIYGTKKVFGFSMAGVAVLAALTPVLAKQGVWVIIIVRILQGLLEAVSFPALNPMVSKWVPNNEKSAFVSFAYVGGTFGSIITNPICGVIIPNLGWEAVFYITAGVTLVWFILWMLVVHDMPENHPFISDEEKQYILAYRTFDENGKEDDVPLLQLLFDMLRSPPMISLMMCDFANSWGLYVLVTEGPTFFWEVLGFDISKVGWMSSLPYLGRFIGAQIFGFLSSQLTKRDLLAPLTMQKINVCTEFMFPAAGMVWLSYVTDNTSLCVAILSISFGFNGAIYAGHTLNGLTIAPNRSGTVMGLSNGFGSVAGIFVPLVKDKLVGSPATCGDLIHRWRIMFAIPAAIYAVVAILFLIFSSGEVQHFDKKEYKKKYCFLY